MAKVVINNGDTGAVARGAINDNFTELYDGKVDKETGKGLSELSFTTALKAAYDACVTWIVDNGTNILNHIGATGTPHVTSTEKNTWNGKQDALGFTAENSANKKTTLTDSDTDYPTTKAVNTGLSAKQNTGSYEVTTNKKTDLTDNSDTYYPTQKAVKTAVDAKQNSLGYTPLNIDQTTSQTIINGQPIQDTLTASELVSTDANKKLQSLAVTTYPSLTELSYVKGVTSAIQTQIGTKISKATGATYTLNSVSCLTAAEYAAITPDANTLYFII